VTGVVVWLGHEDHRVIADLDEETVAALDLEPTSCFIRNRHEEVVRDPHTHCQE
jgi:hypothetical protein